MVKPIPFLISVFSVLAIVTACQDDKWPRDGGGSDYDPYSEPSGPVARAQREAKALGVPLTVYPGTIEQAPKENGQSPFGIMVGFPTYQTTSYCSVGHVALRKVALASHCLKSYADANDYYFVFFDRFGKKRVSQGKTFLFRGDPDKDDIAIVETDDRDESWDVVKGKPEDTSRLVKEELGTTRVPVTVWAFDPESRDGQRTMSFHPRQCQLYRPLPKIVATKSNDVEVEAPLSKFSTDYHFFMDECDTPTMQGNSGALITSRNDLSSPHGVLDGTFGYVAEWKTKYKRIDYVGSDGKRKAFTEGKEIMFFEYGALFEHVIKTKPGTL